MSREKIVLPKFNVPGHGPNWAMRALVAVGGLVVVMMGVFALVIWKQQSAQAMALQLQAQQAQAAAAAAPARPTQPVAQAPAAAAEIPAAASPQTADSTATVAKADKKASSHHASGRHAKHSGKALAKVSGSSRSSGPMKPAAASAGKPDALDALLKQFK